jgi:single-stranded-DNA-specific exonuclease
MDKKWMIPPGLDVEESSQIDSLISTLKVPKLIAELLFRRGLRNQQEIEDFFHPDLSQLHDPFLFQDMEKAVERVIRAINNKEAITIYGDYDVDGTTATALMYLGLKRVGAVIDFYIPHRMIDGYGLSLEALIS